MSEPTVKWPNIKHGELLDKKIEEKAVVFISMEPNALAIFQEIVAYVRRHWMIEARADQFGTDYVREICTEKFRVIIGDPEDLVYKKIREEK